MLRADASYRNRRQQSLLYAVTCVVQMPTLSVVAASLEVCLSHGLKRRVLGLFGTPSTFALLHKISKLCPAAAHTLKTVLQRQQEIARRRYNGKGQVFKAATNVLVVLRKVLSRECVRQYCRLVEMPRLAM